MKHNIPNKIHIIGSVGSGKTTLARQLSSMLNIPFYELDNVVWKRHESGDIRRTEEEREEYLNTILHSDTWIVEGIHNEEWVANSFHNAELIIFLDTNYSLRTYRIIKRFVLQKLGLEKSNYRPTLKIFFKMFKWNKYFEEVGKPNFFKKFQIYSDKLLVVTNKNEIENYFNERLNAFNEKDRFFLS
ncbi:DNA topology modulation protein FlaR [Bacillus sp. V3-13]|uniref:AAA family ATPase n=1 Tax=Bacillus sp. V3-13 TaxID=2053728 RepID=UPI000C782B4C|nr:AAA family ATPase [Bacillus sp. V3-13]PLR77420.1 DNA topology modulation protein FlaR [Bacillus sp. V3-13]